MVAYIKEWCNYVYRSVTKDGQYVFDIPTVASSMHVQAMDLTNQLQYLKVLIVTY